MVKSNLEKLKNLSVYNDGTDEFSHFILSQLINLVWVFIMWFCVFYLALPENGKKAMEFSVYFIPVYFILAFLMYFVFWKPQRNCQPWLIFAGIIGMIGGGIWIGCYFGMYNQNFSLEFKEASNCKIMNVNMTKFEDNEKYAALQIQFKTGNYSHFGYACASTQKYASLASSPLPYMFYEKGSCLEESSLNNEILKSPYYSTQEQKERIEEGKQIQKRRILKVGGRSGGSWSRSSRSRWHHSRSYSSSSSSCNTRMKFAEIKISAWNCLDFDEFQGLIENKNSSYKQNICHYASYGDGYNAQMNGVDKFYNVQLQEDFYLVNFGDGQWGYHDKTAFILLFAFCFMPFMLFTNFWWIPYLANKLHDRFVSCFPCFKKKKTDEDIEQQQSNNDFNDINTNLQNSQMDIPPPPPNPMMM